MQKTESVSPDVANGCETMTAEAKEQARVVHYWPQAGLSCLFRPLPKTKRLPALEVTYQPIAGGLKLEFSAKNALGIPEQTLLLVLLELAKEQYAAQALQMVVDSNSTGAVGKELWTRLNMDVEAAPGKTLRLETTWYELNRRCGTQTGGSARAMRESQLKRLCEVIIWEIESDSKNSHRQSFLVVWLVGNDDRIHLALNTRLASALMGSPYAQVSLTERLALDKDVARAVHAFLSSTVAGGNSLRIGVDTLVERFWPGSGKTGLRASHRRHRHGVRESLIAIGRLEGWTVEWERVDLAKVVRHSAGVRKMTSHNASKTMSLREQAFAIIPSKTNDLHAFDASGLFFNKSASA